MDGVPVTGAAGTTDHSGEAPIDQCEEFIRLLYAEHGTLLLRYAARLLGGDWHRAEDILQEATFRAWKHASTLGMKVEEARPWLYTVVKNLIIDHHRARKIRPPESMSLELLEASVADEADRLLTSQVVLEALDELTEQHREIIKLMYYLECSVAQVSEHLGIPPGTVKSRSYYALRALKKALASRGVTS
ncbi:sigma-70 family RNA polymerase sigma factor [Streptomyces sp. NBC_00568]|uniref:sigma-70 family RNA polymerase sigma factor n=1 Tax=Streptomyces sp. NBC_00568 TaxID=2975779 RepID=UPI002259CC21|nr:sigma-70 family RNA polymerase sigma factor [Streptomyces sp. NBC_00568]MCX4993611.1 sigma-70 family RNA polymerase sigma factor [Streptomyces sp. NBC_00568]